MRISTGSVRSDPVVSPLITGREVMQTLVIEKEPVIDCRENAGLASAAGEFS